MCVCHNFRWANLPDRHCGSSGHSHKAEYLQDLAQKAVTRCQEQFGCTVGSFVTDNAANMSKMRRELAKSDLDIVTYGCSAHLLNLLAHDVEVKGVKEHVVQIFNYFRNVHLPAAWYRAAGGKALIVPQDVRWNTLADCLENYLQNWPILLRICEEHRADIDKSISSKCRTLS